MPRCNPGALLVDAVASRVQTAVTMRKLTSNMAGVVKGMDQAMKSMNLEQVFHSRQTHLTLLLAQSPTTLQISMVMEKFESQFEDMDVQASYMENSIGQSTATSTPQEQVDELIMQVADENGLEMNAEMPVTGSSALKAPVAAASSTKDTEHDALEQRLAALRNA